MSSYFVITASDGEISIDQMSKEDASKYIQEKSPGLNFLSLVPYDLATLGDDEVIIVKGDVIVPKSVEVITKYEIA